jgi:hypothetical protein
MGWKETKINYKGVERGPTYMARGQASANEEVSKVLVSVLKGRHIHKIVRNILNGALTGDIGFIRLLLQLLPHEKAAKAMQEEYAREKKIRCNLRRIKELEKRQGKIEQAAA